MLLIENIFMDIFNKFISNFIVHDKSNNAIINKRNYKILFDIYDKMYYSLLFDNNLKNLKLSSKQFDLICKFLSNNINLLKKYTNLDDNEINEILEKRPTKIKIYNSIERKHYAELINHNLIGLYFPKSKYLNHEIKKIDNVKYDESFNVWLIEVNKNNFSHIKKFLQKNKFIISERLNSYISEYEKIIEESYINISLKDDNLIDVDLVNISNFFMKYFLLMEQEDEN